MLAPASGLSPHSIVSARQTGSLANTDLSGLFDRDDSQRQFLQLFLIHVSRCFGHVIESTLRFRERDHLANVLQAGE